MRSRFGSQRRLRYAGNARVLLALALLMSAFPLLTAMQPAAAQDEEIIVGLITKTETNPFFVTMREGAQAAADAAGVKLLTGAGAADVDNAGQTAALENMVAAGAQGIMITPGDTKAIVPAIQKARDAGVLVIALDTPTEPMEAVDALFATDNFKAGFLIGQYAKAVMGDTEPIIATIDTSPGVSVSVLRHNGFLAGYGGADESAATPTADMSVFAEDSRVVCSQDGQRR